MAAILDFDVVTYFSMATYYTLRVIPHTPNFNLLGSSTTAESTMMMVNDITVVLE
jgi:hypothetical protein